MKGCKIVLKIILPIALLAITMSFVLENMVVKTITNDILAKKVSGYFLDQVIHDFDVDKLGEIETKIRESKYTQEITSEYIDTMIANLVEGRNQSLDITDKVNQMIEKELKEEIPEEKKQEIISYLQRQNKQLEERLEEDLPVGLNNYPFTLVLKMYHMITSLAFRISMVLLTITIIVLFILFDKKTVLKDIQMGVWMTAILSSIVLVCCYLFSNIIEQKMSGGWIDHIDTKLLIAFIVVEVILSIVMYGINQREKEEGKSE